MKIFKYLLVSLFIFLAFFTKPLTISAKETADLPDNLVDQKIVDLTASQAAKPLDKPIIVHLFVSRTCPHCKSAEQFLQQYQQKNIGIETYLYHIDNASEQLNSQLLVYLSNKLTINAGSVPLLIIGEHSLVGFGSAETTGQEIDQLIKEAQKDPKYQDIVTKVAKQNEIIPVFHKLDAIAINNNIDRFESNTTTDDQTNNFHLPLIGQIDLKTLSLPVLSVVLGLLDGFNPCAMWTLLFLISLLLGLKDKARMWLLGITFIVASSFVYFMFMAAWLNFFLFVGLVSWIRFLIGLFALGAGLYYLRDYQQNKEGACKTDLGGKKQKVFFRLKEITHRQNLFWALLGIILLAVAVNMVELLCSAGLPAIFTQTLILNQLPKWQYYAYLSLYILFFMLDDIIVFVIAMKTVRRVGLDTKYARYSHLIGGILMLMIGLAMLFKPELLTFA